MSTTGTDLEIALREAIERVAVEQDADIASMLVVQTSALANLIANVGFKLGTHSLDEVLQMVPQIRRRLEAAVDSELLRLTGKTERN